MLQYAPDRVSVLISLSLDQNFDEVQSWLSERIDRDRIRVFHGLSRIRGMEDENQARERACSAIYDVFVGSLGIDLVHVASPFDGFGDDVAMGWTDVSRSEQIRSATVYDLIPFMMPESYLPSPNKESWYRHRLQKLAEADLLLTISEHTRRVVISELNIVPDRVINISADSDPTFRTVEVSPDAQASILRRYGITRPFIMHTGIIEDRKNVELLIQAFALLTQEVQASHDLVLVGDSRESAIEKMRTVARASGMDIKHLVFAGFVPDDDLAALYSLTTAAVMPSLMEGFGLPLLEAMRCGAPVLGADATSIPEVIGHSDFLFDPRRPATLTAKLMNLLTDPGFISRARRHSEQRQKCFSWKSSAARAFEAFSETIARSKVCRSTTDGKSVRYVLIPPKIITEKCSAAIKLVETALGTNNSILVEDASRLQNDSGQDHQSIVPESIVVDRDRSIVFSAGATGLDRFQWAALDTIPAVLFIVDGDVPFLQPNLLYLLSGYRALKPKQWCGKAVPDAETLAGYPNVLGVLCDCKNLPSRIAALYETHPLGRIQRLVSLATELHSDDRLEMAVSIAENQTRVGRRLLVDISELVHRDARTGIQRVVRSVLKYLLSEYAEVRVEPIYRDGDVYRYARRFTFRFIEVDPLDLDDAIVDFYPSDVFLGLDLDAMITEGAIGLLRHHSRRGTRIIFVLYDLLPLLRPGWFDEGLFPVFARWTATLGALADTVIAISRSSADQFISYLDRHQPERTRPLGVTWWHLGSDICSSTGTHGIRPEETQWLERLQGRTIFLLVGTVEPRKGIWQFLDAADKLWASNHDFTVAIVGKNGWNVQALMARIKYHSELGKRLFRFEAASDEVLEQLYTLATALVLPSEGEGFGLPIVEAARRGVSIIARDLPVFREVAGGGAYYFTAHTGEELAAALSRWLQLYRTGTAPSPKSVCCLSWSESAQQLLQAIGGKMPYRTWLMPNPSSSKGAIPGSLNPAIGAT
jgi:glycosyltransferase involved in cell wall biosynthesis